MLINNEVDFKNKDSFKQEVALGVRVSFDFPSAAIHLFVVGGGPPFLRSQVQSPHQKVRRRQCLSERQVHDR